MIANSDTIDMQRAKEVAMSKTASIYTRVEPEVKEQAEQVLSQLGIPVANAINLFLHQVILKQAIPFEVSLPRKAPLDYSKLTKEEFSAEIEKGFGDLREGRMISSRQLRQELMEGLNI
jgi:addiction module RelB/DinJ family antitoxin